MEAKMQVVLKRINDAVHFEASNPEGNSIQIDGSEAIGGEGAGFRPMQLLLTSVAACASMDLLPILRKQRQDVRDVSVLVHGERAGGKTPSPFESIHIVWSLTGTVDRAKAERAAELAVTRYCSVAETLAPSVRITWAVEIVNKE
jgi:putative redox protein